MAYTTGFQAINLYAIHRYIPLYIFNTIDQSIA